MAVSSSDDEFKAPHANVTAASSDSERALSQSEEPSSGSWLFFWRGPRTEEQKLLLKLDLFIMSWACYGYFIRLLDTSNMTNAYVSGMKEDLNIQKDEYNYFSTFWTIGYIVGMIPSQIIITRTRPSYVLPVAEVVWAVVTFCFAAVKTSKQVYAMRFLIGLFESPFYVGAMTLLGNWYTPKELATRAGIFYSASFAANMFSGYLQAGVYSGLDGHGGLAGWRWLFIMCGVITVPGAFWGFFVVPDSPYSTKVFYLSKKQVVLAKERMVKLDRTNFNGISLKTFKSALLKPFVWVFIVNYIFFCMDTYPLSFFAIYLKSLKRFSVEQINTIPTSAQGFGFLATIFFGFISDKLRNRPGVAVFVTLMNVVSCSVLAAHPSMGGVFAGYILNAGTFVYGPIMITYLAETFSSLADERALILGIAQTLGATFTAWLPLLIFNTGSQGPLFHKGFLTVSIMAGCQVLGVLLMWYLGNKLVQETRKTKEVTEAAAAQQQTYPSPTEDQQREVYGKEV